MFGLVAQVLGDFLLYRSDQRAAPRVAQSVIATQGEIDVFGKTLDETMRLGKRCASFEDDGRPVVGFVEALEHPGDPVVLLDMDRWNADAVRRGLNELQVRVRRLVQPHRMFQARESG